MIDARYRVIHINTVSTNTGLNVHTTSSLRRMSFTSSGLGIITAVAAHQDTVPFDIDLDELQRLLLNSTPSRSERQRATLDTDARHSVLRKFCRLCKACNLDYMQSFAPSVVLALCSKFRNKEEITHKVASHVMSRDNVAGSNARGDVLLWDNSCVDHWCEIQASVFNTVTDWVLLLEYITLEDDIELRQDDNPLVQRMRHACQEAELGICFHLTTPFLCMLLLHVYIDGLPSVKLVERFLARQNTLFVRDLGIKVLRAVNNYQDARSDMEREDENMSKIYAEVIVDDRYLQHMRTLMLHQYEEEATNVSAHSVPQRIQLRFMQAPTHHETRSIAHTFGMWSAQQQFSVVSSRQRQLILYFALVQPQRLSPQLLLPIFTQAIVLRYAQCSAVPRIDVDALAELLMSMRVYRNNIGNLIDFRSTCLRGLSARQRESMSLLQVLQLYATVYQHESVRNELWKRFCPVLNHTTIVCIDEFVKTQACDYEALLHNMTCDDASTMLVYAPHATDIADDEAGDTAAGNRAAQAEVVY